MLRKIRIDSMKPNDYNLNELSKEEFSALVKDMKENGLSHHIIVRPIEHSKYEIVDGEHRWRAAKELEWPAITCNVRKLSEIKAISININTNKIRGNINPIKLARNFQRLIEMGMSQREIARMHHMTQQRVSQILALLKYPQNIQNMIANREISLEHARVTMTIPDPYLRNKVAEKIVKDSLSVRATRSYIKTLEKNAVKKRSNAKEESKSKSPEGEYKAQIKEFRKRLRSLEYAAKQDPSRNYDYAQTVVSIYAPDLWRSFNLLYRESGKKVLEQMSFNQGFYIKHHEAAIIRKIKPVEFKDYIINLVKSAVEIGISRGWGSYVPPLKYSEKCTCGEDLVYLESKGVFSLSCPRCGAFQCKCEICHEGMVFDQNNNAVICGTCGFRAEFNTRILQAITPGYYYYATRFGIIDKRLEKLTLAMYRVDKSGKIIIDSVGSLSYKNHIQLN